MPDRGWDRRADVARCGDGDACDGVVSQIPAQLSEAFELVHRIGPTLAGGTRGNPRQIKRFLRHASTAYSNGGQARCPDQPRCARQADAARGTPHRGVRAALPVAVVRCRGTRRAGGRRGRGTSVRKPKLEAEQRAAVETWMARPGVAGWLELDPPLAGVALGPYFSLARDKLSTATPAARLPAHLRGAHSRLQAPIDRDRDVAVARANGLEPEERALLGKCLSLAWPHASPTAPP